MDVAQAVARKTGSSLSLPIRSKTYMLCVPDVAASWRPVSLQGGSNAWRRRPIALLLVCHL